MTKIRINKIEKDEIKATKKPWSLVVRKNMIPLVVGIILSDIFSISVNSFANDVVNQSFAKFFGYRPLFYLSSGATK